MSLDPYDAVLLLSFGGPEKPEDVVPFLENVTRGRGIPPERLVEVGAHYFDFGGRSPINDLNRDLIAALEKDFADHGLDLPVYWGNRNWAPYVDDALAAMQADGVTRACVILTSAYASYSSCRTYRETLAASAVRLGTTIAFDKVRAYFNHPGFVAPVADGIRTALTQLPAGVRDEAELVFVTHSIPGSMNAASGPGGGAYEQEHRELAAALAAEIDPTGARRWDLAFCSRSGDGRTAWLEPDVNDHLRARAEAGTTAVVVVPFGFISDHMEVIYDLDTQAMATAAEIGITAVRSATAGTDARFVAALRDLVVERAAQARGESAAQEVIAGSVPLWSACEVGCCANPRGELPASCGVGR